MAQFHKPTLLFGATLHRDVVPFRPTHCANQKRIGMMSLLESLLTDEHAVSVKGSALQRSGVSMSGPIGKMTIRAISPPSIA